MFINRLQSADLLSQIHGVIHKIIIQAMGGGCFAVRCRRGQMLSDPPGLVTKLAVEAHESLTISAASLGYHGEHVFAEPCQQLRANLRTKVLSRRILGGGLKLLLKFCVLGWIEFKEETGAVFQRNVIRFGQWIIFFAQRVN